MLDEQKWKISELKMLGSILAALPESHVRGNAALSALVRQDYLTHRKMSSLSVAGIYHSSSQQILLYNPAFWQRIEFSGVSLPSFKLTLLSLIGYSLFENAFFRDYFASTHYPEFDKGKFSKPQMRLFDREMIHQEMHLDRGSLVLARAFVSLDKSFAYFYACYALLPDLLRRSRPQTYQFFKDVVFSTHPKQALMPAASLSRAGL